MRPSRAILLIKVAIGIIILLLLLVVLGLFLLTSRQTSVVFDCDAQGRLTAYTSTQGQVGMGSGLVSGAKQK